MNNDSMKKILATTYALNPYKGSEDGMGWNFVYQIARYHKVVAVTRNNNRPHIEKYLSENQDDVHANMEFLYYDLPSYLMFWKKGGRGAMLYFYLWQLSMPMFIRSQNVSFDIAHNLNFHNDWTPSRLSALGKPMVWGPIGHHPKIPNQFLKPIYGAKAAWIDQRTWILKKMFWNFDPFLKRTAKKADHIFCMNLSVQKVLKLPKEKTSIMPSVASEVTEVATKDGHKFSAISVGRFVPLKGFDVTIRAFALFVSKLPKQEQSSPELILVGSGPSESFLRQLVDSLGIKQNVRFISWIEREKLADLYAASSVFLFPSHEGAGMVVSEAMSYGLPVLCFDNAGPGEFVPNDCGRKVAYGLYEDAIDQFGQHIMDLYSQPKLLEEISLHARSHFEKSFQWNVRGEQLKKIYSKISDKV